MKHIVIIWLILVFFVFNSNAWAETKQVSKLDGVFEFDLSANSLSQTLINIGLQANVIIFAPHKLVSPYRSSPIIGVYTLDRVLQKTLWRSSLDYRLNQNGNSVTVEIIPSEEKESLSLTERVNNKEQHSVEEIVVTGLRASLLRSVDFKRDSDDIVDIITAEDIDKFPDSNVAESLQRVAGVSISRSRGEGSELTIRGISEDYNMVTLNGRTFPAAIGTKTASGAASSRAFDFTTMASEGISKVSVYKSSNALLSTGGIGATIDVETHKPFDLVGFQQFVGVKVPHQTMTSKQDSPRPDLFTLTTWSNDNYGASWSLSSQKRQLRVAFSNMPLWLVSDNPSLNSKYHSMHECKPDEIDPIQNSCVLTKNFRGDGSPYVLPLSIEYGLSNPEFSRLNTQLTLQYRPVEILKATLDYTHFEKSLVENTHTSVFDLGLGSGLMLFDDGLIQTPKLMIASDLKEYSHNRARINYRQKNINQISQIKSLGANFKLSVSEDFDLILDIHDSKAVNGPKDRSQGTLTYASASADALASFALDFQNDLPLMDAIIDDTPESKYGTGNGFLEASDLALLDLSRVLSQQNSSVTQLRLDGKIENKQSSFHFGLDLRRMLSESLYINRYKETWLVDGLSEDPQVSPDTLFTPSNLASSFQGYNTWGLYSKGFEIDMEKAIYWAENTTSNDARASQEEIDARKAILNDRRILETALAAYIQLNMDFDLAWRPSKLIAGLRYESTDTMSTNNHRVPLEIVWVRPSSTSVIKSQSNELVSREESYEYILPSLDLKLDLSDTLTTRVSYDKTLSRASYDKLEASNSSFTSPPYNRNAGSLNIFAGNPNLNPIESNNFDISLEWYFGDLNYLSMAFFHKKLKGIVSEEVIQRPHLDLRDVTSGPRVKAAREALLENNPELEPSTEDVFNQVAATEYNDPNLSGSDTYYQDTYDIHPNQYDPIIQFSLTSFSNKDKINYSGVELSYQQFFRGSGFGFLANYTYIDKAIKYDVTSIYSEPPFTFFGVSNNMNLIAMYDKGPIQARLAYTWRGKFLNSFIAEYEPSFTESYFQVDFILNCEFGDNISVSLEGVNVTEEGIRQHGRSKSQLIHLEQSGALYQLGLRYSF